MVTLSIFLVVLVLALAFFLFFKLLKGVIKALIAVLFLVLFVLTILGVIVYFDVMKVKNSFNEEQTVILTHDEVAVAGFKYAGNDDKVLQVTGLDTLTKGELNTLSNNDYESEKGITLIINSTYFIGKNLEVSKDVSLTFDEQKINMIFTCEKLSECTNALAEDIPQIKDQLAQSFEDEQDFKNKIFFNLFALESKETKGTFILKGIRDEQITIRPQLITIKLIQMMPEKIVTAALKSRIESAADSATSLIE